MVRNQRRRHVAEMLEDERGREVTLAERLEEVIADADGSMLDDQVFGRLDPEDVAIVRDVLLPSSVFEAEDDDGADSDWTDEEIARLQDEIVDSRRRQLAFERYLDALDS